MIVPKRYKNASFENYIVDKGNQQAFNAFKKYTESMNENFDSGKNFILTGNVGTGKTMLAYAFAIHAKKKWQVIKDHDAMNISSIEFTSMWKMIEGTKASFKDGGFSLFEEFKVPNWLIIDEIGIQYGTDFERKAAYDLFNYRYENMLPTIMISNHDKDKLYELLGQRICDRIFSNSEYYFINSESRR